MKNVSFINNSPVKPIKRLSLLAFLCLTSIASSLSFAQTSPAPEPLPYSTSSRPAFLAAPFPFASFEVIEKIEKEFYFTPGKTELAGDTRHEIYELRKFLERTPEFTLTDVLIQSYEPKNGNPRANSELALKRAGSIKWFLEYNKIDSKFISIKTLPYTDFEYNCDLKKSFCQARENRVHLTITGKIQSHVKN